MWWDKILEVPRLFSSNLNYLSSSQRSILFNHIFIFCQEFNEKSRSIFKKDRENKGFSEARVKPLDQATKVRVVDKSS